MENEGQRERRREKGSERDGLKSMLTARRRSSVIFKEMKNESNELHCLNLDRFYLSITQNRDISI